MLSLKIAFRKPSWASPPLRERTDVHRLSLVGYYSISIFKKKGLFVKSPCFGRGFLLSFGVHSPSSLPTIFRIWRFLDIREELMTAQS